MKSKKVLIIGVSGFVGNHLLDRLRSEGAEIVAYARRFKHQLKGTQYIQGDLREESTIKKALLSKPQTIFLLAGLSGAAYCEKYPARSWDINVLAQMDLIKQILKYSPDAHLIFSSSRHEYGRAVYLPVNESHPLDPICIYGLHKSYVSHYLRFLGKKGRLKSTILRTANLYGPHHQKSSKDYNIVNYFTDEIRAGKQIHIFGRGMQLRDYVFIDDFIELLWRLSKRQGKGTIYNIGSGKGTSLVSIAKLICKSFGTGEVVYRSWPKDFLQVETGDYVTDIKKVTEEIGWNPKTKIQMGLAKILNFA